MGLRSLQKVNSYSAGIDFARRNLTSKVDPRAVVNVQIFIIYLNQCKIYILSVSASQVTKCYQIDRSSGP